MTGSGDLTQKILGYLGEHDTMVLATIGRDGRPRSAPVFYCHLGFKLYFMTDPETEHGRNLSAVPHAAASITDNGQKWVEIRGLQLEGAVEPVENPVEKTGAMTAYLAKFPFAAGLLAQSSGSFSKAGRARLYRFEPERMALTDNRLGFGHRQEIRL